MRALLLAAALLSPLSRAFAAEGGNRTFEQFRSRLAVEIGVVREIRLVEKALGHLNSTPTGRPLVERFVDRKVSAKLEIADFAAGARFKGGSGFVGQFGKTTPGRDPMLVTVNTRYLDWARAQGWSEDRLARALAGFLAHELLGHALEGTLARRAGKAEAFNLYEGNELNALLAGWLTQAELDLPMDDPLLWDYLGSPARLSDTLRERGADYAVALPLADLRARSPEAYAARSAAVEAARAAIAGEQEKNAAVLDLLDHFSAAHRPGDPLHRPSKALEWLRHDALVYQDDYFPAREKKLAAAAAALRAAAGQLADGDISTQAADPLFDQWEAAIAANTAKLKGLMKGRRPPEQAKDWPAGQVTMAELTALYEKDAAQNPAHWTARAEAAPAP